MRDPSIIGRSGPRWCQELSLSELSDEDKLGACFEGVEEEDDVFVLELLEDFDLVAHDLDVLLLLPFFFIDFIATNCPVNLRRAL